VVRSAAGAEEAGEARVVVEAAANLRPGARLAHSLRLRRMR